MNRIRILPDLVANQIAAGEVVERPASVLKELLENAIDAGATSIRIEIRGGGKSLIRVSDNGHGMSKDDALLCLERHATSKIYNSADIGSIQTLGFRGEAIPSIASVSQCRFLTCEEGSASGIEIDIHGGKLLSVKEAGCKVGTMAEVRNLFYNLPARRKFLRSDATELGHLHHNFLLHAIAQPQIAWTFQQDDRMVHELAPSIPSEASDDLSTLRQRVRALYGPQLASQLLPVEIARGGVNLYGFVGKPGLSRSNRSELYCFVNSRPVDSRAIYYGLIEGYHTTLMRGRYPVCFLFLEIDPALVDVNIHPAKREVRFREDARVQGTVVEAVRRALGTQHGTVRTNVPLEMTLKSHPSSDIVPPRECNILGASLPTVMDPSFAVWSPTSPPTLPTSSVSTSTLQPSTSVHPQSAIRHPEFTILGVFANLYVIAMDANGLVIVDQHAAHERILFEQWMARLERGAILSQKLLLPQTIELSPKDTLELRSCITTLEKLGFGIAEFGDRSFIVDAVPPFLKIENLPQLLRSILDEFNEAGSGINRDRFAEETVAKTVCRYAVKANDVLRLEELERMLVDLQMCRNPLTCPHGRPTILRLTQAELERKFGRRPMEG